MRLKAAVIGNDHYNTLNVIRALGRENIEVYLFVVSPSEKNFISKSRYVKQCYSIKDEGDIENALISTYIDIGSGERIPLIPTCDSIAAAVDLCYDALSRHFILPSVGCRQGLLTLEMDKDRQLKHAVEAGFDVPKSIRFELPADISKVSEVKFYPCLIKPETSFEGTKREFRICQNGHDLKEALKELSAKINNVLVQQFIPNDEVILIGGVRTLDGSHHVYGEINKFKHSNSPSNLGLNCLGVLSPDSDLAAKCRKYTDAIDYHGCYSIEVLRSTHKTNAGRKADFFVEINLRTDGLFYIYNKAGINFPGLWVKSCYGIKRNPKPTRKHIYGMTEFNYLKHNLSLTSIKDFFKTDTFSLFSISDIKPFLYKFIYHGN